MLTERLTMKTLNALVIKGPGLRAWGARGPTLRAALKLTKCMANILCVKSYNLLASLPHEAWGPVLRTAHKPAECMLYDTKYD